MTVFFSTTPNPSSQEEGSSEKEFLTRGGEFMWISTLEMFTLGMFTLGMLTLGMFVRRHSPPPGRRGWGWRRQNNVLTLL